MRSAPELRFEKATRWGEPPAHRPELGPCLLYLGGDNGNGYGQFSYGGKNGYAHRYAWERDYGPIPSGLTVDHLCRVRICVNSSHMELVDGPENTRRAAAARGPRTHCRKGHEYAVVGRAGTCGQCRECKRINGHERWLKKRVNPPGVDPRVRYDQALVRSVIAEIRTAKTTISQGARQIGCNPNYLGRRVWRETRSDVLDRDGHSCVICAAGDGESLDVHHRINRGAGGAAPRISFGMSNLITVCRPCHMWITEHTEEARAKGGWCLRRSDDPREIPILLHGLSRVCLTENGYEIIEYELGDKALTGYEVPETIWIEDEL